MAVSPIDTSEDGHSHLFLSIAMVLLFTGVSVSNFVTTGGAVAGMGSAEVQLEHPMRRGTQL